MFHVNALDVDLIGNEYVVTLGASNQPTSMWALGRGHALHLILKIAEAEGLEIPVVLDEKPKAEPWTPWVVKKEGM